MYFQDRVQLISSLTMDHQHSAQDVLRCHLCKTPACPLYCDSCHMHLCTACVGNILSRNLKNTKLFFLKCEGLRSTTKCQKHLSKVCQPFCEQCDIPICAHRVSSREHHTHTVVDIAKGLER